MGTRRPLLLVWEGVERNHQTSTNRGRWRAIIVRALFNHHVAMLALFFIIAWLVRFGSGAQLLSASYAGNMTEDAAQFIWHFLHFKKAVFGESEFAFTDQVFYPVGIQMVRQDWAPSAGLIALPFQVLGPLAALNLEVLLTFVLCGYATYLLAHHLCQDRAMAFLAGIIFAFCEFRIDKSFGHINQANQQFIPLYVLFMLLYFQRGRWRYALGAAVWFYLATFCTYYQMVFVLLITLLFLLYQAMARLGSAGWSPRRWPASLLPLGRRTLGFGLLMVLCSAPLFIPVVVNEWHGYIQAARSLTDYMPEYSADLLSYVVSNLYILPEKRIFSGEGGTAFIGHSVLALFLLSLVALRWRTGAGLWIFLSLTFFVISLGSTVVVAGEPVFQLPVFDLLQALPIIKGAKVAARFASLVTLCVALTIAITLAHLDRVWLGRSSSSVSWWLKGMVIVVVSAELLIPPARFTHKAMPTPYKLPSIYSAVAELEDDIPLLQFPLCWDTFTGNIGPHRFPRQLFAHQTLHGKPIFSGIGNMMPVTTLRYLMRMPLVGDLVRLGTGDELLGDHSKRVRAAAAQYAASVLGLRLIVVYKRHVIPGGKTYKERWKAATAYVRKNLSARLAHEDDELLLFTVPTARREGSRSITFDQWGSLVHLGGGWQRTDEDGGWKAEAPLDLDRTREIFFRLQGGKPAALALTQRCSMIPCAMALFLNNKPLKTMALHSRWQRQHVNLPSSLVRPGLNRLRVESHSSSKDQAWFPIGTTGLSTKVRLQLVSAGAQVGDRASVMLADKELVPNTRGYNFAVLDPNSGEPLTAAAFDLVEDVDEEQSQRLVSFVRNIKEGMIVCVVVRDDGSMGLTKVVVDALRTLGAGQDLSDQVRASYAMVGVKGARPGTAMEKLSLERPVVLALGRMVQIKKIEVGEQ